MQDEQEHSEHIVALIPGGGWMIYHSQEERTPGPVARFVLGRETAASAEWSDPVVAWALLASGAVVPLGTGPDGAVWAMSAEHNELWHPDGSGRYQDHLKRYRNQMDAGGS